MAKRPLDIALAFERIAEALRPYPPAALFALADEGYDSLFEVLVACILSIRTLDEVLAPAARRLFALAHTPAAIAALAPAEIDARILESTYHESKAVQIHEIALRIVAEHGGVLPWHYDALVALRGVGPKCANPSLGIACGQPRIGVDIDVHRVTMRCTVSGDVTVGAWGGHELAA
jgi:endonuclease-3